jgi:ATP-dependent Clp protease ATP-binding subunit ClpA
VSELPAGTFGDSMAPDAEAAWVAANRAAVELGHSWVGTEHLLLGLLAGPPDDPAVASLVAAGVTGAAVRDALTRHRAAAGGRDDRALLATLGIDLEAVRARTQAAFGQDALDTVYASRRRSGRRLARGPLCGLGVAPRAKQALEQARRTAKVAQRARFDSSDLLNGLLAVQDGMAVRVLRQLGVDLVALRDRAGQPAS